MPITVVIAEHKKSKRPACLRLLQKEKGIQVRGCVLIGKILNLRRKRQGRFGEGLCTLAVIGVKAETEGPEDSPAGSIPLCLDSALPFFYLVPWNVG